MASGDEASRAAPPRKPEPYPAEKARGAQIILRTPARKIVFFGGLIGIVLFVFIMQFVR
jgi:hypothetical protein